MDNLQKFLEMYSLLRWNQEEKENMKRQITNNEIKSVVQREFTKSKSPGPDGFTGEHLK